MLWTDFCTEMLLTNHPQFYSIKATTQDPYNTENSVAWVFFCHASSKAGAYVIGILGTVCIGLAIFGYLNTNMTACIGFAVPGFIGWTVAFAVYHIAKNKKEAAIKPILEQYFFCLLHTFVNIFILAYSKARNKEIQIFWFYNTARKGGINAESSDLLRE